jgi:predicted kinase
VATAPDVIWLNGAFGVGKTTVAELLVERIGGATVIDPETIGEMLRELLPAKWQEDDWQDIPLWRSLTRGAIDGLVRAGQCPLVIPMTVARHDYFDEIVGALQSGGVEVRHFTLVARGDTVLARLVARDGLRNEWARGRVADCVTAPADPRFAEHVDAEGRDPVEIAADLVGRLGSGRDDGSSRYAGHAA